MDIQQLMDAGGFSSEVPVKKTVTWNKQKSDGKEESITFDVLIKKQSFGAMERIALMDLDKSRSSQIIANSVLLKDGKESLTYEQAFNLDPGLAATLLIAINEVNAREAEKN